MQPADFVAIKDVMNVVVTVVDTAVGTAVISFVPFVDAVSLLLL